MKKFSIAMIFCALLFSFKFSYGVEGMWIPTLLKKYNIEEMQKMGFKLTAEDIYDVNHASMKDAVVLFGSGCTGELISNDGLLITNHHCGFGQIQKHSSLEHDYLSNGFWAKNRTEELANPGLSVQFLVRMEDVTELVLSNISPDTPDDDQKKLIARNIEQIKKNLNEKNEYQVDVKPLFYGNQYFAYIYEVYKDVRLVGAPPVSIGKFGGDTDNWVWPRHTGDFSLFRVYANQNNKPAPYSPSNVPFHPKKFFSLNLKGVKEGDFTMVFGFPGSTQEYIPSQAVALLMEKSNPNKVDVRSLKLSILEKQMANDPKIRIQYSAKYANVSNAWKKWQGETKGLERLNAIDKKRTEEKSFSGWVNENPERIRKYGSILTSFDENYKRLDKIQIAYDLYNEAILRGSDVFALISRFDPLFKALDDSSKFNRLKKSLIDYFPSYLKDYDFQTDRLILSSLLKIYLEKVNEKQLPQEIAARKSAFTDSAYLNKIYQNSIFSDSTKVKALLKKLGISAIKKIKKDKLFQLYNSLSSFYNQNIEPEYQNITQEILKNQKKYMAALLEMKQGERMMADANLTLRVTYGKVEGFEPMDGVYYHYFTTLKGIIEKQNPTIADYTVPEKLQEIYRLKDYGIYANTAGELPVAFCASNHTTGGNSGSPVINAEGDLIGVNFDRCWEGTMSDVLFDPERCRNIALDIRYALFVIDKFAGAGYLLNEMNLIR